MTAMGAGCALEPGGGVDGAPAWASAVAACPKHMAHGPCAGVSAAGGCEVAGFGACAFVELPARTFPYRTVRNAGWAASSSRRPFVLTDLPVARMSSAALLGAADVLRGATDALLLGDHGGARLQFPPSYRARLLTDAGHPVWAGIHCRDRNRVAIEGELAACADAGVRGVHCVTGDHPSLGDRPDAAAVFDLDSLDVVALAETHGLPVSVAHAPSAPPTEQRVPRLLAKVAAGATTVVVDHCGGPDRVAHAVAAVRQAGFAGTVLACVPAVFDAGSARVVESFAAGRLPQDYLRRVLTATDPVRAGIAAATELAVELLTVPGVDGVNLSGGAPVPETEADTAQSLAEVGRAVHGLRRTTPEVGAR